jgi:hypothetical protein
MRIPKNLPSAWKERESYKERAKHQGLFTKPPLDPPKLGGLARFDLSVDGIVSAPTSLIAYVVRVTECGAANRRDKGMLHTSNRLAYPVP